MLTTLDCYLLGLWEGSLHEEGEYYDTQAHKPPPLREVIRRWAQSGDKPQNYHRAHWYAVEEIWPHREYTWRKHDARNSPQEWDAIAASMREHGWRDDEPAWLMIGGDGSTKLGEGNHRLAIAKQLRFKRIPVAFLFRSGPVTKGYQPTGGTALKSAIKAVPPAVARFLQGRREGRKIAKATRQRRARKAREAAMDPRERRDRDKKVDQIMDLLGF